MQELKLLEGDQLVIDIPGLCGWIKDEKLLGDNSGSDQRDRLSIPCEIKESHKEPVEGLIIGDRGNKFDVQVKDQVITIAKIYVFPLFPSPRKRRTSPGLSPSKKSRRDKGKGSGSVHYRGVKRGLKTYRQAYFHYEKWSKGDRITKSSKYIPKKLESRILRMNQEKAPVEEILKVLNSKSKKKK